VHRHVFLLLIILLVLDGRTVGVGIFVLALVSAANASLLAAVWIVPLLSRSVAGFTAVPIGLLAMLALYVFALRTALSDPTPNPDGAQLSQA